MAATALLELASGQLAALIMAAVGADEAIGPSLPIEGVEAWVFGAVAGEEVVETAPFLEVGWVACHGGRITYLSLNYMDRLCTWLRLDQHVDRKPSKWTGRSQLLAANSRNRSYVHKRFTWKRLTLKCSLDSRGIRT